MKKKLLEMLKAKEEKRDSLKAKGKASNDIAEVRSISEEVDGLNSVITELRAVIDGMPDETEDPVAYPAAETRSLPGAAVNVLGTYGIRTQQTAETEKRAKEMEQTLEKRGADLKNKRAVTFELDEVPELRAVTLGTGKLVVETKYSSTLNDTFNQVSSTVDLVNAVPLNGGESYEKGFVVSYGEGDYTDETGEYDETDAEFDYVPITKAKITAYTEMSDEATKLPNINYQELVRKNITIALRKKMSKQILAGPGGANALVGIFKAPANVIPVASDLVISDIDADTLDKIVLGYGGSEDVEGNGYLILNKKDLAAFAAIRSTTGEKLYKITLNGNTGTISSSESFEVPFVINSACAALSDDTTAADTYCMAYGMMHCYEMPLFSPVTVEESRDFKFRTGQIAYRGSVWAGGNVAMYKGFIRVKKGV
jgi:HK97 family phage major capsid protein